MNARKLLESLGQLDVTQIIASLQRSIERESEATAIVVAHLAVMEREGIHTDMGYPSLYAYCTKKLGRYSKQKAYKRIRAARAALLHPEILDHLESGALSLTAITALARHLNGGVVGTRLLAASLGKSVRQIQALVAARFPDPYSPRGELRIDPVGEDRVRIQMVVSTAVADKLELARDIARDRNPKGDVEPILSEALDLFVAHSEKKLEEVERPEPAPIRPPPATVPTAARRDDADRDQGPRAFAGSRRTCEERAFIPFDSVEARPVSAEHLGSKPRMPWKGQPLCAAHQFQEAELELRNKRFQRARAWVRTERALESALTNLGVPRTEIQPRIQAALMRRGLGAPFEALLRAALEHVEPPPHPRPP